MARKGKKKSDKKLGQAARLSGKMWAQWRNHILETSTTWLYYVVITLTRALCACVSKVLKLRGCDFHWSGKTVTIAALKHQPQARLKVCLSCTLEVSTFARVSGTFLLKLKRSVAKTFLNLKLYVSRDPAARNCEKSTAFQVNKMLLNAVHPTFRSLSKKGKSLVHKRSCAQWRISQLDSTAFEEIEVKEGKRNWQALTLWVNSMNLLLGLEQLPVCNDCNVNLHLSSWKQS